MKYLLVLRHPFFLKNFAAGIKVLIERGHAVQIVFSEPVKGRVGENLAGEAAAILPGVRMHHHPRTRSSAASAIEIVSTVIDVLRYDTPAYAESRFLRHRASRMIAPLLGARTLIRRARAIAAKSGYPAAHAALLGLLDTLPPPDDIVALLREAAPAAVILSPVTPFGSEQANYVLAARSLGIPAIYSMYSWDNLTNKGMLRPLPDAGIVWNDSHLREAVDLHGMGEGSIALAGAPGYDVWFEMKPTEDRAAFCTRVGLDPARPFILYTCSSGSIAREHEAGFVAEWIRALRDHPDPDLAKVGVLVRPHPQNAPVFAGFKGERFGNVVVHPRAGAVPFAGSAREDFFSSIAHSMAVVGINTSAMVEAAIIDRPILAFESETFDDGHLGTPHYRQLLTYEFLIRTRTIPENLEALARIVHGDEDLLGYSRTGNSRFVDEFIRPGDRLTPAALRWADAVETLSARLSDRAALQRPPAASADTLKAGLPAAAWVNAHFGAQTKRIYRGARRRVVAGAQAGAAVLRRGRQRVDSRVRKRLRRAQDIYIHLRLFGIHGLPLTHPSFVAERERKRKVLSEKGLVARIFDTGPFRLVEQIEGAFGQGRPAPEILMLGDSVHYRVRYNDRDGRTLAEMVADMLAPRTLLSLAGSAYHPRLFLAIVRAVAAMPTRPATIVIPVNPRCFSPQWWLRPENDYGRETEALEGRSPADPAPVLPPYEKNRDLARYRAMEVHYPGVPFTTIGEFLDVVDAKVKDPGEKERRNRLIATFHFMHPLAPDHPWLADLVAAVETAAAAGMRPLVYVTPVNHMWGERALGPAFADRVRTNLALVRAALAGPLQKAGGRFEDWSMDVPDTLFFNRDEKTEHLADKGRKELAARIVALLGATEPRPAASMGTLAD